MRKYVAHRQTEGIVATRGPQKGQRVADVSNSAINRELQVLKRAFSLAIRSGRIAMKPHIAMLKEPPARSGFFERPQVDAVKRHLPPAIADVIEFAFLTGWRVHAEVLPLQWRNVDLTAGEVRLDAERSKNGKARTFYLTGKLRRLLEARKAELKRVTRAGHITPLVFFRMVAEGRGGTKKPRQIVQFTKAWRSACADAGCPGRTPHDLRRSAVRTFVRAGLGEQMAMELSGHLTSSVFRRYNIIDIQDRRDAALKLDAFDRPVAKQAR